jgi:hypothetical protein
MPACPGNSHVFRHPFCVPDSRTFPRTRIFGQVDLLRGGWRGAEHWPVTFAIIEDKSSGIGIIQEARTSRGDGITVIGYNPGTIDKLSRETVAQARWRARFGSTQRCLRRPQPSCERSWSSTGTPRSTMIVLTTSRWPRIMSRGGTM